MNENDKKEKTLKAARGALDFIFLMGIVSLFSDMTHEGGRSVLGEYLNLTGASAATIGFVSGFVDFTLITLHCAKVNLFEESSLSLLYAATMAIDAFAALFFGWLFDKIGLWALMLSTLISSVFSIFVFKSDTALLILIGILIWGIGMGAQESIMKAAVSRIVNKNMRSTGFGIFETGFGIFWFLGSWAMGALYDRNINLLVLVSVSIQLLALVFYYLAIKNEKNE